MAAKYICSRPWRGAGHPRAQTFYVREVPGEGGGKDWGYVDASRAKPISAHWMRRFKADMRRVGSTASCRKVD